jgi:hypothetical protein
VTSSSLERTSGLREPWQVPFSELLEYWEQYDDKGRDNSAIAALCLEDRYYLLINILNRADAWDEWIYERCREVERAPDGYIDIWAREHYKSTIITFAGVIQEILRNPEISIGIFSHTKPIAKGFLAQIKREFETNSSLKALFPKILFQNPEKDSTCWSLDGGIIVKRRSNRKEATVEAHGLVDGQPTSLHFGLLVYDDVVTDKSVYTPEQIVRTTEAWELSDNLGARGGRKWIIGTRYHYADTYSEIIKRGAAKSRIYPATDDGTLDGRPVLFSPAEWSRRKRDQGEATVACQLLANPLAGHQRMFNVEDLQTYEVRPGYLMVYILVDPARSMKEDSDHTAMVVVGIKESGALFLLDGFDHKMDLLERWEKINELRDKWLSMPGIAGVRVGYERYGAQADLQYFESEMRRTGNGFEIAELEWPRDGAKSKRDRIQRLLPAIRGHHFFMPYPTDENRLTKKQHEMLNAGYAHLISEPILRLDENRQKYDLSERLRLQISYFPFGGRVDVLDALARIYDIEPQTPEYVAEESLEPEII